MPFPSTKRADWHKAACSTALPSLEKSLSEIPTYLLYHIPLVVLSLSHRGQGGRREAQWWAEGGRDQERGASDEGDGNQQEAVCQMMNCNKQIESYYWKSHSTLANYAPMKMGVVPLIKIS